MKIFIRHLIRLKYLAIALPVLCAGCHQHDDSQANLLIHQMRNDMVFIKGGTFMIDPQVPNEDRPPHTVTLTSFYTLRHNVSYREYKAFTDAAGLAPIQIKLAIGISKPYVSDHPVMSITWFQANHYCQWIANKTGLPYSLPTEDQWDYVARNNGKPDWLYPTDNGKLEIGKNFPTYYQYTHQPGNKHNYSLPLPINSKPCLPNGVCGMNGQVYQWMKDWYKYEGNVHGPKLNPVGPKSGIKKVLKGSGADDSPGSPYYARLDSEPSRHWGGFRCVINTTTPPDKLGAYAKGYPK